MTTPDIDAARLQFKPDIDAARLQFKEAIAALALRSELRGTATYRDLSGDEHRRAFAVAGAMKADLLADLREAVRRAVEDGVGLEAFRKDFWAAVKQHGWRGWTGEGWDEGEAWRTRVIYTTNLRKSYSAGRYAQLTEPDFAAQYPFWQWVHSGLAREARAQHLAWHGMTLHQSDPFWRTHFPPRIPPDYGCTCRVKPVRRPVDGAQTQPPAGWQAQADPGAGAPPDHVAEAIRELVDAKRAKLPQALGNALARSVERAEAATPQAVQARQQALGFPVGKGWELQPHEVEFYERFTKRGEQVRLIQRSAARLPTNDFFWVGKGVEVEVKNPKKAHYGTAASLIQAAVSKARAHVFVKDHFIIDLGDRMLTRKLHSQLAEYNVRNPDNRIRALWVMTKGELVEIALLDQK